LGIRFSKAQGITGKEEDLVLIVQFLVIMIIIKLILLKIRGENRKILNIRMAARHCYWRISLFL
jgi:hypothetical protein